MNCGRDHDPGEHTSVTERLACIFVKAAVTRFQDLAYAYDPVGNPVLLTDQLATSTFSANTIIPNTRRFLYDPRYRLVTSTGKRHKNATDGVDAPVTPAPAATDYLPYTHRYSYDAVGNFTTNQEYSKSVVKYKAGLPDRFDGVGAESYGYDANGCVTSTPRHTSIGYQFDAQPTLIDLGGGGKIRLRRHGDQRVVRFRSATNAIRITLGDFEYEKTAGYTKVILHLQGPAGRCAQVEKLATGTDATSLPVFHVHGDHLGSGQALTKADATLLCQEEFFAYGRSSDRRDARNRYRFIGVERDEDTGLCMTGPRTYDPIVGRFLQGDPVVGGTAYVYSRANPVSRFDDNGYADDCVSEVCTIEVMLGKVDVADMPDTMPEIGLATPNGALDAVQRDATSRSLAAGIAERESGAKAGLAFQQFGEYKPTFMVGGTSVTRPGGIEGFIFDGPDQPGRFNLATIHGPGHPSGGSADDFAAHLNQLRADRSWTYPSMITTDADGTAYLHVPSPASSTLWSEALQSPDRVTMTGTVPGEDIVSALMESKNGADATLAVANRFAMGLYKLDATRTTWIRVEP